jgi:RNA recognition motif-containing protein
MSPYEHLTLSRFLMEDPILLAMHKHERSWGDLLCDDFQDWKQNVAELCAPALKEVVALYETIPRYKIVSFADPMPSRVASPLFTEPATKPVRAASPLFTEPATKPVRAASPLPILANCTKTIIVRNFPRGIALEELRDRFQRYGDVRDIYIPKRKDPGSLRHGTQLEFACIKYDTTAQSAHAVRMISDHGLSFRGKKVKVTFAKTDDVHEKLLVTSPIFVKPVAQLMEAARAAASAPLTQPVAPLTQPVAPLIHPVAQLMEAARATRSASPLFMEPIPEPVVEVKHAYFASSASILPADPLLPSPVGAYGTKTIIARNLPRDISSEEVYDRFQLYGVVRDIYLPRNRVPGSLHYGTVRGFALIKYNTVTQSARAIRVLSTLGLSIRGKQVTVEFAKSDTATRT